MNQGFVAQIAGFTAYLGFDLPGGDLSDRLSLWSEGGLKAAGCAQAGAVGANCRSACCVRSMSTSS